MIKVNRIYMIIARGILYIAAGLLIVFVGAFLSLQTRPVRDAITGVIVKAIEQNTRAVCRIEALSGNLFSRFEIKGVELKDSKTGIPLMSAGNLDVSYSIPMLLRRVLWINRLTVDGASVNLIQTKGGTWNFEMLAAGDLQGQVSERPDDNSVSQPPNSEGFPAFKVEVRRLMIRDSDVTLVQQTDADETIRHFKGIECQARLVIGKEISAKIRHLAVRMDNPRVDLTDLSGDIRYDFGKSQVDVHKARIQGGKSDFTVDGRISFFGTGQDRFKMDLRADIKKLSLGEFGQAFPIQMPDEDIVSGNISVAGPVSKMDCQVDLRMDKCHVASQGLVIIDASNDVGLDLAGKISSLDLSALPVLDLNSFRSDLNTDFSLVWQQIGMPDQTGKITLDLTSSQMWGYLIDKAALGVRIAGDDFIFEHLQLKTPYGKLAGSGTLAGIMSSETDNQIQFAADLEGVNPEKFVKSSQYTGNVNGNVRSTIFIPKTFASEGITAEATCRIDPSRVKDIDIQSADIDAAWRDEKVTLKRFDLQTLLGTAAVTGTASIKDETCRFNAAATLPDIELIKTFIPDMGEDETLSGNVSFTADISGRWEKPDVAATVNAENVIYKDVSADSLIGNGHWNGGFKDFSMSAECGVKNIQSSGLKIPVLNFTTTMTPASMQADVELQGGQKEEFKLSGNISGWLEPVKEVLIDKMTLVSFNQPPLVNQEPVKLSVSSDRIRVDSLHLVSGDASLVLKGEAGMDPLADVSAVLMLRDLNLKRLSGFWEDGEKIQGRVSSDIQLSGFLENPVINMTASIKEASYDRLPVTDMSVALKYEDSRIDVTGSGLRQGRKIIDANGSASMHLALFPFKFTSRPESLVADLNVDEVDLSEFSAFLAGGDQVQGRLSSNIQLSGFLEDPIIDIELSIKEGVFDKFSVSNALASITYSDSKAQIEACAYRQNEKLLDVNGTALVALSLYPFEFVPKPGGLDLTMGLDQVDIAWISDIINDPEYDIRGILDATASVSGDVFKPQVQGRMRLKDGALDLKKQGLIYENLTADLRFAKETITIDDLKIKGDTEGTLHLSGALTHDNFKPRTFNIRAVGDQLYIPFHSGVYARINPDITLSGAWEAPVLSGEIKVFEGQVNLERFLEKKLSEIEIVAPVSAENGMLQIPEKEPEPLEFVDPLAADVAVIIPNDFWFKGKDEFIEIKGNIQLKKDPHKPFVLFGSVLPVRGTYRFRGRIFQIREGELIFAGQEDINPSINIEAFTSIGDVEIIIRLTGTFENLNLVLDSEPALAQSEIIAYLVFGRSPDDLSEKESFQAEEAALSFTGQIAADKLRDIVGETLGIDYLNISAGSGGLRQGSLTMGKYVLPKVFVTFRQGFDETVTQKVEVTYEINKNFDLETQIDNEQTSALDLIWKYEF